MPDAPDSGPSETWTSEPDPSASKDEGSFAYGFAAGLLGGLVMFVLLMRQGKAKTRAGVAWGFGVQVVLLLGYAGSRR